MVSSMHSHPDTRLGEHTSLWKHTKLGELCVEVASGLLDDNVLEGISSGCVGGSTKLTPTGNIFAVSSRRWSKVLFSSPFSRSLLSGLEPPLWRWEPRFPSGIDPTKGKSCVEYGLAQIAQFTIPFLMHSSKQVLWAACGQVLGTIIVSGGAPLIPSRQIKHSSLWTSPSWGGAPVDAPQMFDPNGPGREKKLKDPVRVESIDLPREPGLLGLGAEGSNNCWSCLWLLNPTAESCLSIEDNSSSDGATLPCFNDTMSTFWFHWELIWWKFAPSRTSGRSISNGSVNRSTPKHPPKNFRVQPLGCKLTKLNARTLHLKPKL